MKKLLLYRHSIAGSFLRVSIRLLKSRNNTKPIDLRNIKRILIIRNGDGIGDFVLMSALLRELRAFFSECEIHLVISTLTRPLAERCPYLDRIIVFDCGRGIPLLR